MEHINITFPIELRKALDREAKREHTKRSTLIQKAVKMYLELKRRHSLHEEMREGYKEMAEESLKIMDEFKVADSDSLKYVD